MAGASKTPPELQDHWCTNDADWSLVRRLLGPDFADASPSYNRDRWVAPRQYRNAFRTRWRGRIYCNPPYSEIARWIDRGIRYREASVLYLLPARTDSNWFASVPRGTLLFFPRSRRRFVSPVCGRPGTSPRFGSVWVLFSADRDLRHRFELVTAEQPGLLVLTV